MQRRLAATFLLGAALLLLGAAQPTSDAQLVGTWGLNGQTFCTFKADGTGSMEGDNFRWSADGQTLVIMDGDETERVPYKLQGDNLVLQMGGIALALERMGKDPTGSKAALEGTAKPPQQSASDAARSAPNQSAALVRNTAPNAAGSDQLSQLLLSSAWCSFTYNKVSGASHASRVQFFQDGTWSRGARGETYSSGYGGIYAGQTNTGNGGQWQVKGEQLWMSNPPEAPQLTPLNLQISRNSSGYPILHADGKEYSQCQ
jgi:hypothetical protein